MKKFRILAWLLVLMMVLAGCGTAAGSSSAGDIVILYTNDAHCGIEDGLGYAGLAAVKNSLTEPSFSPHVVRSALVNPGCSPVRAN